MNPRRAQRDPLEHVLNTGGLLASEVVGRKGPLKIVSTAGGSDENWNWSSFQLANSTPPLSVTGSAIAPSARMSTTGALMSYHLDTRFVSGTIKLRLQDAICVA